jgi:hypothetical protein
MTTRIKITNEGPEMAVVRYYGEDRNFKPEEVRLRPTESLDVTVWDGNIPVVWAEPLDVIKPVGDAELKFMTVPPATY